MELTKNQNIGELVATDYRTAQVFKNHHIDFCCHGNRSIEEACREKNLDAENVLQELKKAQENTSSGGPDFRSWPLDLLADYVEKKHHRYVEQQIPVLKEYLAKIEQVHGDKHSELEEIQNLFNETAGELSAHMKKEELILFPLIRKLVANKPEEKETAKASVANPIQKMMEEHDTEGARFQKIAELSGNYTPPADACNTYRTAFALLKEFEDDLHEHIHLENNILFPEAMELEKERSKQFA
ncbi:MAG TPA: iron-sulfur cluster repair di-iron protein [Flavobacteriaceae bacterium]|nr:iron-sulfur cluster repair di-iron protein [Flavobacteriaceae bacterium]